MLRRRARWPPCGGGEPTHVAPGDDEVSGFVFKIQANMDPNHRDRVAFVRLTSGRFARGMKLKVQNTGRQMSVNAPILFFASDRELAEEAFAGDVMGIPNHGVLRVGDSLSQSGTLRFAGLPNFAPEILRRVRVTDPLKAKHLKKALEGLAEEGVTQLFRPAIGSDFIVGAVGQLQFEVMADRLGGEYALDVIFEPAPYAEARWLNGAEGRRRGLRRQAPRRHGDRYRRTGGVPGQVGLGDRLCLRALSQAGLRTHAGAGLSGVLTPAREAVYGDAPARPGPGGAGRAADLAAVSWRDRHRGGGRAPVCDRAVVAAPPGTLGAPLRPGPGAAGAEARRRAAERWPPRTRAACGCAASWRGSAASSTESARRAPPDRRLPRAHRAGGTGGGDRGGWPPARAESGDCGRSRACSVGTGSIPEPRVLLDDLPPFAGRGADLGCGIGVLARAVLAAPEVVWLLSIDIDARAVAAARRNIDDPRAVFEHADIRAAAGMDLDFVVMNPPFHDGGNEDRALGQAFIVEAARRLRPGGICRLVANVGLPYEAVLHACFSKVTLVAQVRGYKVHEARK